jgi:hypothetical protein
MLKCKRKRILFVKFNSYHHSILVGKNGQEEDRTICWRQGIEWFFVKGERMGLIPPPPVG